MPRLLQVLVTCLVIVLLLAVAGCGGQNEGVTDAAQDATSVETGDGVEVTNPREGDGVEDASSLKWAKVFTLKGGGEGDDTRYPEEFELQGGERRVDSLVQVLEADRHLWLWYISGEGDGAMLDREQTSGEFERDGEKRTESFAYRLSAGTCYVIPNTVARNWTLTISEKR